eukprot:15461548-Alexandrium_andersonii.AAC.1
MVTRNLAARVVAAAGMSVTALVTMGAGRCGKPPSGAPANLAVVAGGIPSGVDVGGGARRGVLTLGEAEEDERADVPPRGRGARRRTQRTRPQRPSHPRAIWQGRGWRAWRARR